MEITKCIWGEKINPMLKDLLNIPRNLVVSIGPGGCLNVLYNEAVKRGKSDLLYTIPVDEITMTTGEHIEILEKALEEIIENRFDEIDSIIVYETCSDLIMCTNFGKTAEHIKERYGIVVKVLERGPISKRKILPKERLKIVINEMKKEISECRRIKPQEKIRRESHENHLQHFIPPIVSDYSGVCCALSSPEILKIVISPGGCKTPIINDDISDISNNMVFCTAMNELEVLLGESEGIVEKTDEIIDKNPVKMIALIKTPVPTLTGMNMDSIIAGLKTDNIPVISIDTNGFEDYHSGLSSLFLNLGKRFIKKMEIATSEKKLNILGYSSLNFGKIEKIQPVFDEISKLDIGVQSVFAQNLSPETILNAASVNLNLVISHEGISLAEFMKKNFDIPYIFINPTGRFGIRDLKNKLIEFFELTIPKEEILADIPGDKRKVMVISSPMMAVNLEDSLKMDFGFENIKSVTFAKQSRKMRKIYKDEKFKTLDFIESENELIKLIESYNPDIIIGDSGFKKLTKRETIFIPLIQHGYSTRLYLDTPYEYCGENGYQYLKKFL